MSTIATLVPLGGSTRGGRGAGGEKSSGIVWGLAKLFEVRVREGTCDSVKQRSCEAHSRGPMNPFVQSPCPRCGTAVWIPTATGMAYCPQCQTPMRANFAPYIVARVS